MHSELKYTKGQITSLKKIKFRSAKLLCTWSSLIELGRTWVFPYRNLAVTFDEKDELGR